MRIASLLASATEIVSELGLLDQLVSISHECDFPPEALTRPRLSRPRFDPAELDSGAIDASVREAMARDGSVYEIDTELLARLQPDLILAQAVCEVCAVPTSLAETVARALGQRPRIVSLDAHRVADIYQAVVDVGSAAGVKDRAARVAAKLAKRVETVAVRVAGRPRPRVLAIEWLDPPFVPGHWTPEMVELAGGRDLLGRTGLPSRQMDWNDVAGADPDVLVIMPCGYGLRQARADADRYAERLMSVAPRAVETGRAFVVDGSAYFNRSGPRFATGVEILGALLHPELFPETDLDGKAEVWKGLPLLPLSLSTLDLFRENRR
ncbi:MAG: cobalamin-binding protein [Gemmatimonadetes bacterium]|nr:cobalamin-binding protein [Gemmatimonadota bacterium]